MHKITFKEQSELGTIETTFCNPSSLSLCRLHDAKDGNIIVVPAQGFPQTFRATEENLAAYRMWVKSNV